MLSFQQIAHRLYKLRHLVKRNYKVCQFNPLSATSEDPDLTIT